MRTSTPTKPLPTDRDAALAREAERALSRVLRGRARSQRIDVHDARGRRHTVRIPASASRVLVQALTEIGRGNTVSLTAIHAELTTQEAADLLNVSRPFLVQVLEKGDIPFHRTGTHRRVRYEDVLAYKARIDEARRNALDELAAQAQELDMGY